MCALARVESAAFHPQRSDSPNVPGLSASEFDSDSLSLSLLSLCVRVRLCECPTLQNPERLPSPPSLLAFACRRGPPRDRRRRRRSPKRGVDVVVVVHRLRVAGRPSGSSNPPVESADSSGRRLAESLRACFVASAASRLEITAPGHMATRNPQRGVGVGICVVPRRVDNRRTATTAARTEATQRPASVDRGLIVA
ncbi:unnamed protein product [Lampetra planeri]